MNARLEFGSPGWVALISFFSNWSCRDRSSSITFRIHEVLAPFLHSDRARVVSCGTSHEMKEKAMPDTGSKTKTPKHKKTKSPQMKCRNERVQSCQEVRFEFLFTSQRWVQNELIFRLLLKVTVDSSRECEYTRCCGVNLSAYTKLFPWWEGFLQTSFKNG